MAKRNRNSVERIIRQYSLAFDLDPVAVLAVATGEGGVKRGGRGDFVNGRPTSFGPFQLHEGGALPKGKGEKWANSREGILYAIEQMSHVAQGLKGKEAIAAIVRRFERPANPEASIQNAIGHYQDWKAKLPNVGGDPKFSATLPSGQTDAGFAAGAEYFLTSARQLALTGDPTTTGQLQQFIEQRNAAQAADSISGTYKDIMADAKAMKSGYMRPLTTKFTRKSEFGIPDPEGAPSSKGGNFHAAKDWFAPGNSPVFAPVKGKIVEIKPTRGNSGQIYGGVVKIQDAQGRVFVFRHVNPLKLKLGQVVNAGTKIARVTPWKDGSPHSHIEVWRSLSGGYNYENMIDPITIFGGQ